MIRYFERTEDTSSPNHTPTGYRILGPHHVKELAFVALMQELGFYARQIKALRWADVNLEASTVSIQHTGKRVQGIGRVIGQPKTAGSRRPIALGTDVVSLLRKHRVDQNTERLRMGPLWRDEGLVFCSEVGTMIEDKQLREVFIRICGRAGVPKIRLHDLRHSVASLLLAAGIQPGVVAGRLGQSSVNLTLNTYSHVLPGIQQDAADTLEKLLKKA
jgi:integrase